MMSHFMADRSSLFFDETLNGRFRSNEKDNRQNKETKSLYFRVIVESGNRSARVRHGFIGPGETLGHKPWLSKLYHSGHLTLPNGLCDTIER